MEEKFEIIEQKNEVFGTLKVILRENEPWFIGKEVAEKLGYTNPLKAIRDHVEEDDKETNTCSVNETFTQEPKRTRIIINESGLYSLIFNSKLESAKKFKRWVTKEVLPSIRKHGMYITEELLKDNEQLHMQLAEFNSNYYELEYQKWLDDGYIGRLERELKEKDEYIKELAGKIKASMYFGFEVTGDIDGINYLPEIVRRCIQKFIDNPFNADKVTRVDKEAEDEMYQKHISGYLVNKKALYNMVAKLVLKKSEIQKVIKLIGIELNSSKEVFVSDYVLMNYRQFSEYIEK